VKYTQNKLSQSTIHCCIFVLRYIVTRHIITLLVKKTQFN